MSNAFSRKIVIINRAVPGSGKTSISLCVGNALKEIGLSISKHSTDDFFMRNGRYCFDYSQLGDYHKQNQNEFGNSLKQGVDVVFCDNTNLVPWQTAPYTQMARVHGYKIFFLNFNPRELAQHVKSQQITIEKPDAHNVSEKVLISFINDFYTYNSLLDSREPVDGSKQKDYQWDNSLIRPVPTGRPALHFDSDSVITIRPTEYHHIKAQIGVLVNQLLA